MSLAKDDGRRTWIGRLVLAGEFVVLVASAAYAQPPGRGQRGQPSAAA